MSWQWIDTQAGLLEALDAVPASCGVDTEFVREDTFWPLPGLIQLGGGAQVFLLDPLADIDFTPLKAWLESPKTVKIMHAGFEDLELFYDSFDARLAPWFDTQIAWSLVGGPVSGGLDALVQSFGHAPLDKSKSRNNWRARPLSKDLLDYAAQDVVHLPAIAEELQEQLRALGRLDWLQEEQAQAYARLESSQSDDYDPMSRMKGLHFLSGKALTRLAALVNWREEHARATNQARSRIARDEFLQALAQAERFPAQLQKLPGARNPSIKRFGESFEEVWHSASELPDLPTKAKPQRPSASEKNAIQTLRAEIELRADKLDLLPELLAKRRDVEAWALNKSTPSGWRAEALEGIL